MIRAEKMRKKVWKFKIMHFLKISCSFSYFSNLPKNKQKENYNFSIIPTKHNYGKKFYIFYLPIFILLQFSNFLSILPNKRQKHHNTYIKIKKNQLTKFSKQQLLPNAYIHILKSRRRKLIDLTLKKLIQTVKNKSNLLFHDNQKQENKFPWL